MTVWYRLGGGGNDGVICCTYTSDGGNTWGSSWFPNFPKAKVGSRLSWNSNTNELYYVGQDSKIYSMDANSGAWSYKSIHQNLTCQQPATYSVLGVNSEIYYVGLNDNIIHEFYYSANSLKSTFVEDKGEHSFGKIQENEFQAYPNPVIDYLTVQIPTDIQNPQIDFFDLTGKKVKSYKPILNIENIDCTLFDCGVYLIKLTGINYNKTIKFQIVK